LNYSGFEPETFGFQVSIATNWDIYGGNSITKVSAIQIEHERHVWKVSARSMFWDMNPWLSARMVMTHSPIQSPKFSIKGMFTGPYRWKTSCWWWKNQRISILRLWTGQSLEISFKSNIIIVYLSVCYLSLTCHWGWAAEILH
jgi:hypothetical protein